MKKLHTILFSLGLLFLVFLVYRTGPAELAATLTSLRRDARLVTCHPSAGLPDEAGRYPYEPDAFAQAVAAYTAAGLVDIVGGCCGTTPAHIAALARAGTQ